MQKRHLGSLLLALGIVAGFASGAYAQDLRRDRRIDVEHHYNDDRGDYRQYTREGNRRGEIHRVGLTDRELERYRRPFEGEPGWRPQGVTYGLVGPLQRQSRLTFLDDALLVGSFRARGDERVYVYLFDLRGERHELAVEADGDIVSDRVW
jgi:hypothetical protein